MDDDLVKSLIFPIEGSPKDRSMGKSRLLWLLTNFRILRQKLGNYRSNEILSYELFGNYGDRSPIGLFVCYCPVVDYDCPRCPFQIGSLNYHADGRKACALFIIKDKTNGIALTDLLDYIDEVIARASRCAEENKWDD